MQENLLGCAGGSWIGTGDEVALGDQMRFCWNDCALGIAVLLRCELNVQ